MALSIIAICISIGVLGWTIYWSCHSEARHRTEREEDRATPERERQEDREKRDKERQVDAWANRETVNPSPQMLEALERTSRQMNDPRQR